jgi:hypothetical protein
MGEAMGSRPQGDASTHQIKPAIRYLQAFLLRERKQLHSGTSAY